MRIPQHTQHTPQHTPAYPNIPPAYPNIPPTYSKHIPTYPQHAASTLAPRCLKVPGRLRDPRGTFKNSDLGFLHANLIDTCIQGQPRWIVTCIPLRSWIS